MWVCVFEYVLLDAVLKVLTSNSISGMEGSGIGARNCCDKQWLMSVDDMENSNSSVLKQCTVMLKNNYHVKRENLLNSRKDNIAGSSRRIKWLQIFLDIAVYFRVPLRSDSIDILCIALFGGSYNSILSCFLCIHSSVMGKEQYWAVKVNSVLLCGGNYIWYQRVLFVTVYVFTFLNKFWLPGMYAIHWTHKTAVIFKIMQL